MQALVIHYGTCWHMQPRDIQDCLRPYCFASVVLLKDFEASRRHGQTQYEAYRLMADKWMPDGTLKK